MPANLTPQYRRAEEKYRQAQTLSSRLEYLEQMLQLIPRHKGTDRLQGELRARLKELRQELSSASTSNRSGRSSWIPRQGAGSVVLLGAPNAGKSRLLMELTSASPEVAPYPFTTRIPQAGMMDWEDLQVQLIDTPPLTPGTVETTLLSYLRSSDLAVLCLDGSDDDAVDATAGIIRDLRQRKTQLALYSGFDDEDFSVVHVKTLCVVTRGRQADAALRLELLQQTGLVSFPCLNVDLDDAEDLSRIRNSIGSSLSIMRIYTRRPGDDHGDPAPIVLPVGATVVDLAEKIHLELAARVKFAKVWREGSRTGKIVQRDDSLVDRDLVELY